MQNLMKISPLVIAIVLVGCGEGGDSAAISSVVAPSAAKQAGTYLAPKAAVAPAPVVVPAGLYISEVAGNFRKDKDYDAATSANSVAWVELYNKQNVAVNLKDYVLRTGGLKVSDPTSITASVNFALPNVVIPANGYVVIAGKKSNQLINSTVNDASKVIYIKDATNTYLPYWANSGGFIELQSAKTTTVAAKTVDFVRFGTSATAPLTATAWVGTNVPAFATPAADYVGSQSLDPLDTHDQSIVRLTNAFAASKTNADWTLVSFPTSGGPNDVAGNAVSTDGDGIPDSAKVVGGTFGGLDLYTMGARPGRKDMFVQVDYMAANPDTGAQELAILPVEAALTKMVDAFTPHQIAVHFDAGSLYSANVNNARYNLENKTHQRTYSKCTQVSVPNAGCNTLIASYTKNVDPRRRALFRYAFFASSVAADGSSSSSGVSELPGNKVLVTLHGFLSEPLGDAGQQMRTNFQAGTLMHELGHSLSLRHGGESFYINYKPNYVSIMNYLYQLSGLPTTGTNGDAIERFYLNSNYNGLAVPDNRHPNTQFNASSYPYSALPNGPTTNTFRIDYSDGTSTDMDENALNEGTYIGRGAGVGVTAFGDWNVDGVRQAAAYQHSLTGQQDDFGRTIYAVLHDYNDWAHLALVTGKNYNLVGIDQSYGIGGTKPVLIKTSRVQSEDAPSAQVLEHFKQISRK